ncbi:LSMT-L [Symbiodinium pilosum]|uniref:LSMT-L protein n=1 Tax=Symbiodinium pilosum TaxID=2952 RepID=A0A812ITM1_SYMPI|nr:LSMT-L [Symbiodinium pilosum]
MSAELWRMGGDRVFDDFAVALARACFEAWTMSTRKCRSDERLTAEVAELRSELAESQQLRALSQAQVKRLERQLATEQEWCMEASRFCARSRDNCSEDSTGPPYSAGSPEPDRRQEEWRQALDRALLERDQARLEREELRLELVAIFRVCSCCWHATVITDSFHEVNLDMYTPSAAEEDLRGPVVSKQEFCTLLQVDMAVANAAVKLQTTSPFFAAAAQLHVVDFLSACNFLEELNPGFVQNLLAFEQLRSGTSPPERSEAVQQLTAAVSHRGAVTLLSCSMLLALQLMLDILGPSAWKDWYDSGVSAPETHPLKLLLTDPQLAKYLWSCTTCGGQMSGTTLQVRDDMEQLQGSASLEEWTGALALTMSRSLCEDGEGRPVLAIGVDLLQAAEEPVVRVEPYYGKEGAVMGMGGSGPERFMGINIVAIEDIEAGMELTAAYLPQPHGGKYLERFGFVPQWLQGDLAESAAQLSFAPVDEDEDDFAGVKESCLEDLGLSTAPMEFVFSLNEGILPPRESEDWGSKSEIEKMVQLLRFSCCGGTDSFLMDAVYVNRFWKNCNYRISRNNETAVCQTAIAECNRWLNRFKQAEEADEADPDRVPASSLAKAAADLRRSEREILVSVKTVFQQELDLIQIDDTIRYWVDRAMDEAFPDRTDRSVQGY